MAALVRDKIGYRYRKVSAIKARHSSDASHVHRACDLCARLTGKIDPAAGAMLAYVRDDIVAENKKDLQ